MKKILEMLENAMSIEGLDVWKSSNGDYVSITFDLRFTTSPRILLCYATQILSYCDKTLKSFDTMQYLHDTEKCLVFVDTYIDENKNIVSISVYR